MNQEKILIAREDLPLFRERILFCTPRNYAPKLTSLLVKRGALPAWIPTIVIEPVPTSSPGTFSGLLYNITSKSQALPQNN